MTIGVSARARRPTSTPSRTISAALPAVAKFGAAALKTRLSSASTPGEHPLAPARDGHAPALSRPAVMRSLGNRREDDRALKRTLPVGADPEECQPGPDRAEQRDAENGARDRSPAAADRHAADDRPRR